MTVYDNISELAHQKKIPISEVEKRAGLANGTIGGWRNGYPRSDSLVLVSKALGVSITRLMRDVEVRSERATNIQ